MNQDLINFGIGGAIVVMTMKMLFDYLKTKKNGIYKCSITPEEWRATMAHAKASQEKLRDLHVFRDWDKERGDRLSTSIDKLADVLSVIAAEQKMTRREIESMQRKLDDTHTRR